MLVMTLRHRRKPQQPNRPGTVASAPAAHNIDRWHSVQESWLCYVTQNAQLILSQKIGGNKTIFRQTHYMTIEIRGFAPNFNGHIVRLALHLWGLPRIIE